MNARWYAVSAWLQFVVGLVLLGASDYYVRWRDGWLGQTGTPTPDLVWFGVPLLSGLAAAALLWRATAGFQHLWVRLAFVAVQLGLGFAVYLVACVWYVIDTGIDSM